MSEREMKRLTSMTWFNYYYFHQQTSRNFAVFSSKIWRLLIIFIIFIYFYFPPFSIRWRWSVTPDFCQIPNLEGGFWEGPGMAGPKMGMNEEKRDITAILPRKENEKIFSISFQIFERSPTTLPSYIFVFFFLFWCFFTTHPTSKISIYFAFFLSRNSSTLNLFAKICLEFGLKWWKNIVLVEG